MRICLAGVSLAIFLNSCTGGERVIQSEAVIKVHLPKLDLVLDPQSMEDTISFWCVVQLYRGLFRYQEDGEIKADLAERWQEFDEGKRLLIELKKDLKFSDGSPLLAEHFVSSIVRLFRRKASMAVDLNYVQGVDKFSQSGDAKDLGIRSLGPTTIEIVLVKPSLFIFKHLATADLAIVPIDSNGDLKSQVFSGPYKIGDRSEDSMTFLKWRKDDFDSVRPPEKIEISFVDSRDSVRIFESNITDVFDRDILTEEFQKKLEDKQWTRAVTEMTRERFVVMNPSKISFERRKRLYAAVDPEYLIRVLNVPHFKPGYGIIPEGLEGSLEKGFFKVPKNSKSLDKEPLSLVYPEEFDELKRIAFHLAEVWKRQGFVNVSLSSVSTGDWVTKLYSGDSQMILASKGIDYPDGMAALGYFRSLNDDNFFHVKNKKIDDMIEVIHSILDPLDRIQHYKNIQKEILALFTYIPLASGSSASGMWSSRVLKVNPHPYGFHTMHFESITMKDK